MGSATKGKSINLVSMVLASTCTATEINIEGTGEMIINKAKVSFGRFQEQAMQVTGIETNSFKESSLQIRKIKE